MQSLQQGIRFFR